MVRIYQKYIFDNAKNTIGTIKTLLDISDGTFVKLVNDLKPLAIKANSSIIDVRHGFECVTKEYY